MAFHAARDVICDGWHPRAARAEGRDTWLRSWCMPRGMLHAAAHLAEVPDFVDDGRRFLVGAVPATRARIQITLVHRRQRACARLTRGYACVRARAFVFRARTRCVCSVAYSPNSSVWPFFLPAAPHLSHTCHSSADSSTAPQLPKAHTAAESNRRNRSVHCKQINKQASSLCVRV